jgi:hypothetical protein
MQLVQFEEILLQAAQLAEQGRHCDDYPIDPRGQLFTQEWL